MTHLDAPGAAGGQIPLHFGCADHCQFKQAGAVGIVGSNEGQLEALKNFTLDIALRHFYKDVKLFYSSTRRTSSR